MQSDKVTWSRVTNEFWHYFDGVCEVEIQSCNFPPVGDRWRCIIWEFKPIVGGREKVRVGSVVDHPLPLSDYPIRAWPIHLTAESALLEAQSFFDQIPDFYPSDKEMSDGNYQN